jgi:hypothetical protein
VGGRKRTPATLNVHWPIVRPASPLCLTLEELMKEEVARVAPTGRPVLEVPMREMMTKRLAQQGPT